MCVYIYYINASVEADLCSTKSLTKEVWLMESMVEAAL